MLYLQAYNYIIGYVKRDPITADYLSRYYQSNKYSISNRTRSDHSTSNKCVNTSSWKLLSTELKLYYPLRNELSVKNNILLYRNKIIVPIALQQQILNKAHSHHQGVNKTKPLLRQKLWWPGINKHVEQLISIFHSCQASNNARTKYEPLKMSEIPKSPWQTIAIDLKGPFSTGEHVLVIIDYRSRYPVLATMKKAPPQ